MAKPGDLVEFRAGLHGIEAPDNLGFLLDRWRKKGTPWVRVWSVQGALEIKAEHVGRKAFKARYEGSLSDEAGLAARLRLLLDRASGGALEEHAEDDLGALEQALWETACESGPMDVDALAAAHYGASPSRQQRKDILAALDRCRRPGTGRFEHISGETWRPWTPDEVAQMRHAWNDLSDLRTAFIEEREGEEGLEFAATGQGLASLSERQAACFAWVQAAMEQFIEHDGVPAESKTPVAGIGGLAVDRAFGMDLHRSLGFLAMDAIASAHTSRSSDYVHFLLETGAWTPDDAVAALMRRHVNREPFFQHTKDVDAEALADSLPREGETRDDDPDRVDLRHLRCFTIDPPDARDFDDAVGLQVDGDGTQTLWVHIADVSHYVRLGTPLDRHARDRATSVYLPGRVLPMVPARIADDLCSLRDDGPRNAMSIAMRLDSDGRVDDVQVMSSQIQVTQNLAYDDALTRRDAGDPEFEALFDVADRMRAHRRGLAIQTGEIRVHVEEAGFAAQQKFGTDATRMIETFMVAANEAVGELCLREDIPSPYRCHPLPDAQKTERFRHQAATMGMDLEMSLPVANSADGGQSLLDQLKAGGGSLNLFGGGISVSAPGDDDPADDDEAAGDDAPEPGGFAALSFDEQEDWLHPFREAADTILAMGDAGRQEIATWKLLSCMGRAEYLPRNEGHFGLASDAYVHFTSPIRRYPDLITHRNLKWWLAGGDGTPPHSHQELDALTLHCSDQERAAAGLERRIKASCLVLASLGHGVADARDGQAAGVEPVDPVGRIAGITPNRVFLVVDGIDASTAARDLPGGPYHVDEWESMLFLEPDAADAGDLDDWVDPELGERRKVRALLGDRVTVRLAGRDVAEGKTDAHIVRWSR